MILAIRSCRYVGALLLPAAALLVLAGCRTQTMSFQPPSIKQEYAKWKAEAPPTGTRLITPEEAATYLQPSTTPGAPIGGGAGTLAGSGTQHGALVGAPVAPQPYAAAEPYVAELLGILTETKSVDAFVMTLGLLVEAKPDHRRVVPAVIRNAERLGLLADHALTDNAKYAEVNEVITTAIDRLIGRTCCEKCRQGKGRPARSQPTWPGAIALAAALRCVNPWTAGFFMPIPVTPWDTAGIDEPLGNPSEHQTPVLPPIAPGYKPQCGPRPDRAEILRAVKRGGSIPAIYEQSRDDYEIVIEKLVDKIDPPRFFPLIGPAQLHHCHWKCTVSFNETIKSAYPFPFKTRRRRSEVVYIDKDHLHLSVTGAGARVAVDHP